MKLFKDASKQEHQNWNKAVSVGFYILLLLLFVNTLMYAYNGAELVSSFSMFWTGIIVTFGYQFILNKVRKNEKTALVPFRKISDAAVFFCATHWLCGCDRE
ncbi:hypothetical protein ABEX78_25205 [Priestia megaterium]